MVTTKTFSISEENAEKLKETDNQSKIINDLLNDYFKINQTPIKELPIEVLEKKKTELEQRNYEFMQPKRLTDEELRQINEELQGRKLTIEESNKIQEQKKVTQIEAFKINIDDFFYVKTGDELQKLAELYYIERYDYNNLWEWGKAKGLKEKDWINDDLKGGDEENGGK